MEMKEILVVLRNIHYKCFFIGFLFFIAAALLYMPCRCFVANLYQNGIGIDVDTYYDMWVSFIGLIKVILIFLFLVPALAIHWVAHVYNKEHQ